MLSKGEYAQKRGRGVSHPIGHAEAPGHTLSGLLRPWPGVLFPDSFRTFPGGGGGPGDLCGAGPIASLENSPLRKGPI